MVLFRISFYFSLFQNLVPFWFPVGSLVEAQNLKFSSVAFCKSKPLQTLIDFVTSILALTAIDENKHLLAAWKVNNFLPSIKHTLAVWVALKPIPFLFNFISKTESTIWRNKHFKNIFVTLEEMKCNKLKH